MNEREKRKHNQLRHNLFSCNYIEYICRVVNYCEGIYMFVISLFCIHIYKDSTLN